MQRKAVTHLVKGIDTGQYRRPLTVGARQHSRPGC
jgi:hypothetical protein